MRENRTYGSEGGDRLIICSLPLSDEDSSGADTITTPPESNAALRCRCNPFCLAPDGADLSDRYFAINFASLALRSANAAAAR